MERGKIPIVQYLLFPQFMSDDGSLERKLVLFMDSVLMGKCSEAWVPEDKISAGMFIEISKTKKRNQSTQYFDETFEEVENV